MDGNKSNPQCAVEDGLIDRFGSLNPSDGGNSQRYTISVEGHERTDEGQTSVPRLGHLVRHGPVQSTSLISSTIRCTAINLSSRTGAFMAACERATLLRLALWKSFRHDDRTAVPRRRHQQQPPSHRRPPTYWPDSLRRHRRANGGRLSENRTQWSDWFRTEGSLRGDYFYFNVRSDNSANSGDVQAAIFIRVQLIFGPWDRTEFYVSGGYGFHSNDARGITTTEVPSTLVPAARVTPLARAIGGEVGLRTKNRPASEHRTVSLGAGPDFRRGFRRRHRRDRTRAVALRRIGIEFADYQAPPRIGSTVDADYAISQVNRDHEAAGDDVPESIAPMFLKAALHRPLHALLPALLGSTRGFDIGLCALTTGLQRPVQLLHHCQRTGRLPLQRKAHGQGGLPESVQREHQRHRVLLHLAPPR